MRTRLPSFLLGVALALSCARLVAQTPPKARHSPQPQSPGRTSAATKAPAKPTATNVTKVALASNTAPPGTMAVLPVYFTPAPGVFASRVKLEITFPSKDLKFQKVERGDAGKTANAEVSSTVDSKKAANGESITVLTVIVSTPAPEGELPPQEIPRGVIASLSFRVSDDARHGSIPLKTSAEVSQNGDEMPVKPVQAPNAEVKVPWMDAPVSVTCFIFSH